MADKPIFTPEELGRHVEQNMRNALGDDLYDYLERLVEEREAAKKEDAQT